MIRMLFHVRADPVILCSHKVIWPYHCEPMAIILVSPHLYSYKLLNASSKAKGPHKENSKQGSFIVKHMKIIIFQKVLIF